MVITIHEIMNKNQNIKITFYSIFVSMLLLLSCNYNNTSRLKVEALKSTNYLDQKVTVTTRQLSQEFKDYWYAGNAEITSFKLEQARYGEIHKGHAVLIFVTEDFLPIDQVKSNNQDSKNISVLKLNTTKKFNTGIYPYSIMQSTFYPVYYQQHALKTSCSVQEWCGHNYTQLNNKDDFEINSHSYFAGEADQNYHIEKDILENELWTQLRIDPNKLPTGKIEVIPSFEFSRLKHIPVKPYKVYAELTANSYTLNYTELKRTLVINFDSQFPYSILGWTESFKSGFGQDTKILTTKATKLVTIKSPYWNKNSNVDSNLRETLQLE